ncbi:MAG: energy transducer TonB [Cyanophyceae cyanobacterium]
MLPQNSPTTKTSLWSQHPSGFLGGGGISCVSRCQPSYPSVLDGAEGSAAVQVVVDGSGNVTSATLARANSNSQINRQALLAAQQMKFSAPSGGGQASVQINVNFTVAGSEFDRTAREREEQAERERQAREREQREREAQAERERQERQAQLERERQERERQVEQRQQQEQLAPAQPSAPTEIELEPDNLQERIEGDQNEEQE